MNLVYGETHKCFRVSSYEELLKLVETQWPILKEFKYDLIAKYAKRQLYGRDDVLSDIIDLRPNDKVVVVNYAKEFFKCSSEWDILLYVDSMYSGFQLIRTYNKDPDFPPISPELVSDELLEQAANDVLDDLNLHRTVFTALSSGSTHGSIAGQSSFLQF